MKEMSSDRGQWKSQWGFLLAAVGSAIGLGNIWRFSYMAYENGGGAFLIPYLTALLLAGIPLLLLEFAIGHERIGSAPLAYHKVKNGWEWLGWWAVVFVMFGIVLYYMVVIAWCLNFIFYSYHLQWGDNPDSFFFKEFLSCSKAPLDGIFQIRPRILIATILLWLLNGFIIHRGVNKGIERANKIFMPLLFILTAVLVIWSVNLDGAVVGIKNYITPDFTKLLEPKVWLDAFSQIFFTLSLGFGIMIAYASYLPERSNLSRNAFATAFINSGFSLFAGFGTFAVLGYMASSQGKMISEVVTESIGLAFVAYPKALSLMPGGNIFGMLFFFSLVVAGLSSSISIIEAFVSAMVDKFDYNRKKLIHILTILGCIGSVVFTTKSGLLWLDIVDHYLTHYGLVVVGIFECVLVGWFFNIDIIREHINRISTIKMGQWWNSIIRYFIPGILMVILSFDIYQEVKEPYSGYAWTHLLLIGIVWVLTTLIAAIIIASRPWRTEKHHEGGRAGIVMT